MAFCFESNYVSRIQALLYILGRKIYLLKARYYDELLFGKSEIADRPPHISATISEGSTTANLSVIYNSKVVQSLPNSKS